MDVGNAAVPGLEERVKEVCELRGFRSPAAWSKKAGLSPGYLATYLSRKVRLPEGGAQQLAEAAGVNASWLRDGKGPREGEPSSAVQSTPPGARQTLVRQLAQNVADLTAAGDLDGARIIAESLARLLGQGTSPRVLEHDADAPPEESHQRRKFQPPPPKTGT